MENNMKTSRLTMLIIVIVVAAVLGAGWFVRRALQPDSGLEDFAWSNGRIEATEVNLATKLSGRLTAVLVEEGDTVHQGQVLARLDTRTLEADYRQAEASARQAEHKVAQALSLVASRQNEVKAAKALVAQRRSQKGLSSREAGRTAELFKKGVIAEESMDIDQTTKKSDAAQLDGALAQLNAALAALDSAQAGVLEARAGVDAAQAQMETIQSNIDDGVLTAPISGRVLYRLAEPGEVLAAGGNVLTLLDITNVYMTFFLPTDQAGMVAIGAESRIVLDALPRISIPASITFVSPEAQFTPKSVETQTEREKLMFRIKARISPELLMAYAERVKTGLPGVAYVRLRSGSEWPASVPPLFKEGMKAQ
jgi:HlyD family secretion protein